MSRALLSLLALALARTTALAQQPIPPTAASAPAADPNDVRSVDAILRALYDVISGPAGQPRKWDRFRSLFHPGARLIPTRPRPGGGAEATVLDVEGYIGRAGPYFEKNGFFEKEIARRLETFGSIAHAFSTYASYHGAQDSVPFARGINSIQLLEDGGRWWVVTIYWDSERAGVEIPPEYLPPSRH